MSAPNYVGDTDWKRQAGGSFGFTKDGLQFRELVYRGRLDSAESFIAQFPKGSSSPLAGEGHLNLVSAPVVRDENGVSGSATLRFEGVSGVNNPDEGDETIQWFNEIKEVVLQPSVDPKSTAKYSYISPQAVINYKDTKRRDILPENKRFRYADIFGTSFNNPESTYFKITLPQYLVEATDEDSKFDAPQIIRENKNAKLWNVRKISGFQSITLDASGVYSHIEQHFLVLEPTKQN
jgi:hypothetical protein